MGGKVSKYWKEMEYIQPWLNYNSLLIYQLMRFVGWGINAGGGTKRKCMIFLSPTHLCIFSNFLHSEYLCALNYFLWLSNGRCIEAHSPIINLEASKASIWPGPRALFLFLPSVIFHHVLIQCPPPHRGHIARWQASFFCSIQGKASDQSKHSNGGWDLWPHTCEWVTFSNPIFSTSSLIFHICYHLSLAPMRGQCKDWWNNPQRTSRLSDGWCYIKEC